MNPSFLPVLLAAALSLPGAPATAHEGEAHDTPSDVRAAPAEGTAASAPGPDEGAAAQRQADGSVFVPKLVQYRIGVRTQRARLEPLSAPLQLAGVVVADPNAGGRVQASQAGRVEPGPSGLPVLGQRVAKGQVIAWLQPTIGNVERSNQQAELAAIDAQLEIAKGRVARYEQLDGAVPRKDLEAARVEARALQLRRAALSAGLGAREALRAPVSGVVSVAAAVAGQVVEPRDILFEIVDPSRLAIEALAYDPALADGIRSADAVTSRGTLSLQFAGAGRQLRGQALPLLFRVKTPGVALAVGQPVQVIARSARTLRGVALPQEALVRNRAGEWVVWVHVAPERFAPRRVVSEALDARTVAVASGIAPGDQVVVSGASLLAQVR